MKSCWHKKQNKTKQTLSDQNRNSASQHESARRHGQAEHKPQMNGWRKSAQANTHSERPVLKLAVNISAHLLCASPTAQPHPHPTFQPLLTNLNFFAPTSHYIQKCITYFKAFQWYLALIFGTQTNNNNHLLSYHQKFYQFDLKHKEMSSPELDNCQICFLLCKTEAIGFWWAVSSWFAALRKVHIPFVSTVHAALQAGKEAIKIKVKVIYQPSAYSSAQIPSSSLAQSPHVPLVLFISRSMRLRKAEESHNKITFWPLPLLVMQ